MTGGSRRARAAADLARARQCLRQARALQEAGEPEGAASRAYLAVFHAARAVLDPSSTAAEGQGGVPTLLGDDFFRTGELPEGTKRLLSQMQAERQDADLPATAEPTEEEGAAAIRDAAAFLDEVERQLGDG